MIEGKEVVSDCGAVAAEPEEAARIGARILESGGNAMDAAAATCLACCMLQPGSVGIGGYGGCAVVLEGSSGHVWSVDYNSMAPMAAHEDMFQVLPDPEDASDLNSREYFCQVKDDANIYGPLAVGLPGMMAGIGIIWERWGKLQWREVCAPSQRLLADGFPYAETAGHIEKMEAIIQRFDPTQQHLMPQGKIPGPDDIWHRPDMDKTLDRLANSGWRDFYEGKIGRQIADYLRSIGGILSRADMADYQPRVTQPYSITYRGVPVHTAILPNGNLSVLQILNMLECFDPPPNDTVEYWHLLAEILKLAWRDRLRYLADPDFVEVPVERLLSKEYAAGRVETVRQFPDQIDQLKPNLPDDPGHGTLHVATADSQGNLVSATITQGWAFGSCVTVPGTGIILGHGMCRLDPRPGHANSIAPRKRVLNNCGALILCLPDRDVGTGLPGGRKIVSVGAQLGQRVVDFGSSGYQAAVAPRLHVEIKEPVEITESVGQKIINGLTALGHKVNTLGSIGGSAHCADYLKSEAKVRAGGGGYAAGVEGEKGSI